jgi:hypothetical protein
MPDWRELYQAVVDETNPTFLEPLMNDLEAAMWKRLRELDGNSDGAMERHEMAQASSKLLSLRTEKLGWPSPFHAYRVARWN